MKAHPYEALPLIAEGYVPDEHVRLHLETCASCARALRALSPIDLEYVWAGVAADLDAGEPPLAVKTLERVGLDGNVARLAVTTPTFRPAWFVSCAGVLGLAALAMIVSRDVELSLVLLIAPVLAGVLVAFAYGPAADPAHEIVVATPASPTLVFLVRFGSVLAVTSVLVGFADVVAGSSYGTIAWFFPMTFIALFSAVLAYRTVPLVGAAGGLALWTMGVFAATALSKEPAGVIWGSEAQLCYAVGSSLLFVYMLNSIAGRIRLGTPLQKTTRRSS